MKTIAKRILSLMLVAIMLTAATAISLVSCSDQKTPPTSTATSVTEISIVVEVTNDKGEKTHYTIKTTSKTLRGALDEIDLVKGDESEFGLYVKEVAGVVADYDVDKAYWAFYKSGEMLMTGVDTTMIADGEHYEIVYTK